ncbi:hypothetical protein SAMN06265349_104173 [Flavobacterium resistens]|uniref:Uncharacterized protein n=1 Tax=Flavobacterium resistens TaxID=443612 RepID=A0A521E6D3_9FLAO|nr:hypothetical protein [Flavobacterium resistens]MRX69142.1 hypothetical protein [Flavobacterium resistens]SMO79508.1 hypothetical protein SAMN06265349_104173 [Flavobacterium resistens]
MQTDFSYAKQEEIKKKLRAGTFDANQELIDLIRLGYDPVTAKELLTKVIKSHKDDLYEETKEAKATEERSNVAFGAVVMITTFLGMFGGNDGLVIVISVMVACFCGYYGNQDNPIPGMVGYAIAAVIMPFACGFYFKGRSTILNLEILIPLLFSFGPGLLIKYILSQILPSD